MMRRARLTIAVATAAIALLPGWLAAQTEAAPGRGVSPTLAKAPDDIVLSVSSVSTNGAIVLVPGRRLVVGWKPGEAPVQISEGPAGPRVAAFVPRDANKETWSKVTVDRQPGPDDQFVFSMWADTKDGVLVLLENGSSRPVAYIARMLLPQGDKFAATPTTICAARSKGVGIELWDDPIRALIIAGIVPVEEEDVCIDAASMKSYRIGEQPPSAETSSTTTRH